MRVDVRFNKGVLSDVHPSVLPEGYASDARHIRFEDGVARKMMGYQVYWNTAESSAITGLFAFPSGTDTWVMIGTTTSLASLKNATTRSSLMTSLSLTSPWSIAAFGSVILAANGTSNLQKIVSPYTASADVGGSPPVAKVVKVFQRHAFLLGLSSYPFRVQWSDIDDYEMWTPAAGNEAGDIDLYESKTPIVGGDSLGDFFVIYTENQIHVFQYIGGGYVFARRIVAYDVGLWKQNLLCTVEDLQFFMAKDNFYGFDGTRAIPIASNKIRRSVFEILTTASIANGFVFPIKERGEVWFCLPTSASTTPNLACIYNYRTGEWTYDTIAWTMAVDRIPLTYPTFALTSDRKLYSNEYGDNAPGSAAIEAYVDSPEYGGENIEVHKHITRLYPEVKSSGTSISFYIGTRNNPQEAVTWSSAYTYTCASDWKVDTRSSGRLWRIRAKTTTASTPWDLIRVGVEVQPGGGR